MIEDQNLELSRKGITIFELDKILQDQEYKTLIRRAELELEKRLLDDQQRDTLKTEATQTRALADMLAKKMSEGEKNFEELEPAQQMQVAEAIRLIRKDGTSRDDYAELLKVARGVSHIPKQVDKERQQ